MRNLSCTFDINGITKKVTLRKVPKERKFLVQFDGHETEYVITETNTVEYTQGPEPEKTLGVRIQWMIMHYFSNTKPVSTTPRKMSKRLI
jgi:hypothetical protein